MKYLVDRTIHHSHTKSDASALSRIGISLASSIITISMLTIGQKTRILPNRVRNRKDVALLIYSKNGRSFRKQYKKIVLSLQI